MREKADLKCWIKDNVSWDQYFFSNSKTLQWSYPSVWAVHKTAYCTGKFSVNYELSNTEHHGYISSTMHCIHDVLSSSRCPETNWFLFWHGVSYVFQQTNGMVSYSILPNSLPTTLHTSRRYVLLFWATDSIVKQLSSHQWLAAIAMLHGPPVAVWTGLESLTIFTWYSGKRYKAVGSTTDLNHTLMTSWSLLYIMVCIATPHEGT